MYWGFKKIPFTLYTYVLDKTLQNVAKFIQKLTPGFVNHMTNLDNFRQAVKISKKLKFGGLFLSKKYICPKSTFLQLKHYIRRIYLTILLIPCGKTYQTTYVIFETAFIFRHLSMPSTERNYVFRHFWNHRSLFMTQVLCIFIAQTLHTFYKSRPSKSRFPDFRLVASKLSKFLKSFFKP